MSAGPTRAPVIDAMSSSTLEDDTILRGVPTGTSLCHHAVDILEARGAERLPAERCGMQWDVSALAPKEGTDPPSSNPTPRLLSTPSVISSLASLSPGLLLEDPQHAGTAVK